MDTLPEITLAGLFGIWRASEIRVLCEGLGGIARHPQTPQKIRGALGTALRAGASDEAARGLPCPFDPPCAYSFFHTPRGSMTKGREIPKPYVVEADALGPDLLATVRLFGEARSAAPAFKEALVAGLRIGLEVQSGRRLRPTILGAAQLACDAPEPVAIRAPVVLEFLTPVMQSRDGRPVFDPATLLTGLGNRIAGLAVWQGARLALDTAALKDDAVAMGLLAQHGGADEHWHRSGRNNAGARPRAQTGRIGWLRYPPPDPQISALLQLGLHAHIGAKCAAGPGRYRLCIERPSE